VEQLDGVGGVAAPGQGVEPDPVAHAVTGPDGKFTIEGVPPGKYTLATWHERTGKHEQPIEVTAGGTVKAAVVVEGK